MKAYLNFIATYGKQYSSKSHASKKYEIFKSNYKKIEEHNVHTAAPFVMGVNQFADMTAEEFSLLMGVEIPRVLEVITAESRHVSDEDHRHHHHKHHHTHHLNQGAAQVESINWHEKGAVGEPKDQSMCGSCWAFTTTGTLEALAVISGEYSEVPNFSMQQLLDCDETN